MSACGGRYEEKDFVFLLMCLSFPFPSVYPSIDMAIPPLHLLLNVISMEGSIQSLSISL